MNSLSPIDMTKLLLLFAMIFVINSCGKLAHNVDPNYIGYWKSEDNEYTYSLKIPDKTNEEGQSDRWKKNSSSYQYSTGSFRITKSKLRVGLKSFSLDQPVESDGINKTMIQLKKKGNYRKYESLNRSCNRTYHLYIWPFLQSHLSFLCNDVGIV